MRKYLSLFLVWLAVSTVMAQEKTGTLSLEVVRSCQVIVDNPNQPIHFDPNENKQAIKNVQIISNGFWKLIVKPQDGYLINERGDKIDVFRIGYSIQNVSGEGNLTCPQLAYKLYIDTPNPPFGHGNVEFDVVFDLDTEGLGNVKWGNYNTKVEFICVSREL